MDHADDTLSSGRAAPFRRNSLRPEDFGEIVRQHEGGIRAFLRSRIRDWAAADDLAQDVFVTAFRKLNDFRNETGIDAWLRGIAANHLRNFLRKRREQCIGGNEELQALVDRAADSFWAGTGPGDALDALRHCLSRIDASSRALLEERYGIGRTVREISVTRGRGYSALTMQLHRLRELLAACIQRQLDARES